MADDGTSVTPCSVFTSSRVFTNWFGKSASFSLAKSARPFTVPVVVSIWLSRVSSCRWRFLSVQCDRRHLRQLGFLAQASYNRTQAVFGYGENHRDGLQLRNDREVAVPAACTTLPGSTRRKPDTAGDGSGNCGNNRTSTWILMARALIVFYGALVLQSVSFSWSSTICFRNGVARQCGTIAIKIHVRLGEEFWSRSSAPCACRRWARDRCAGRCQSVASPFSPARLL